MYEKIKNLRDNSVTITWGMIREIGNTIQEAIFKDNNGLTKKTTFSNNWMTTFLQLIN